MITERERNKRLITAIPLMLLAIFLTGYIAGGLTVKKMHQDQENTQKEEIQMSQQLDTLTDWQLMQMAIIYTESRFNPNALGKSQDKGIFQMVPIYIREVNRLYGTDYISDDAYDIDKALEMFELIQQAKNPERDLDKAIYYHNKSPHYRKTVLDNLTLVQNYELIRAKMLKEI